MTEPGRPVAGWPRDEPWAQVAETHAAAVFLAGDRAYKLKKPVNLGSSNSAHGRPAQRRAPARSSSTASTPRR
jgi:aminoglycoside phosphotransferase family enzyme